MEAIDITWLGVVKFISLVTFPQCFELSDQIFIFRFIFRSQTLLEDHKYQ